MEEGLLKREKMDVKQIKENNIFNYNELQIKLTKYN